MLTYIQWLLLNKNLVLNIDFRCTIISNNIFVQKKRQKIDIVKAKK